MTISLVSRMPKTIVKLVDAGRKLRLKKMQIAGFKAKASKDGRVLVGFYKDEDGKTKPITRSARELNRKKIIKNSKKFGNVKPRSTGGFGSTKLRFKGDTVVAFKHGRTGVTPKPKGGRVWSIRRVFFSKGVHTVSAPLASFKIRNVKEIKRANLAFKEIVAEEKDDRSTDRVFMQDNEGYIIQHRRFPRKHYSPPLSEVAHSRRWGIASEDDILNGKMGGRLYYVTFITPEGRKDTRPVRGGNKGWAEATAKQMYRIRKILKIETASAKTSWRDVSCRIMGIVDTDSDPFSKRTWNVPYIQKQYEEHFGRRLSALEVKRALEEYQRDIDKPMPPITYRAITKPLPTREDR